MKKTEYPRSSTRAMCAYYKRNARRASDMQSISFWGACYRVSKGSEQELRHLTWAKTSDH